MKRQHGKIATHFRSPMFQLTQFIQNTFVRIIGTISQLFGFVGQALRQLGGFTNRIFGLNREGGYFLDANDAPTVKRIDRSTAATEAPTSNINSSSNRRTRRRPGKEINHFRNMAREIKNS